MNEIERSLSTFIANELLQDSLETSLELDDRLLENGTLDSFALQELLTFIAQEFSLTLEDEHLVPENFENIRAIARLVARLTRP